MHSCQVWDGYRYPSVSKGILFFVLYHDTYIRSWNYRRNFFCTHLYDGPDILQDPPPRKSFLSRLLFVLLALPYLFLLLLSLYLNRSVQDLVALSLVLIFIFYFGWIARNWDYFLRPVYAIHLHSRTLY